MIRILVAADSSTDRGVLVALLETNPDHTVIAQTDNGVEAVELAIRLKPDLVAMEIDLPLLDGIEATREIMARVPTRIVVLSAGEDGPDLGRGAEALRAGAVTVVPKPQGRGPFSDLRNEIFLEMVRAATRKDFHPRRGDDQQDTFATSWLRPSVAFSPVSLDPEQLAQDFDISFDSMDLLGLPLTVEDRATRIRRLMDDIR